MAALRVAPGITIREKGPGTTILVPTAWSANRNVAGQIIDRMFISLHRPMAKVILGLPLRAFTTRFTTIPLATARRYACSGFVLSGGARTVHGRRIGHGAPGAER